MSDVSDVFRLHCKTCEADSLNVNNARKNLHNFPLYIWAKTYSSIWSTIVSTQTIISSVAYISNITWEGQPLGQMMLIGEAKCQGHMIQTYHPNNLSWFCWKSIGPAIYEDTCTWPFTNLEDSMLLARSKVNDLTIIYETHYLSNSYHFCLCEVDQALMRYIHFMIDLENSSSR